MPIIRSEIVKVPCTEPFVQTFTAPPGHRIATLWVDGIPVPGAKWQSTYTLTIASPAKRQRIKVCYEEMPNPGGPGAGSNPGPGGSPYFWTWSVNSPMSGGSNGSVSPGYWLPSVPGEVREVVVTANPGHQIESLYMATGAFDAPSGAFIPITNRREMTFDTLPLTETVYLTVRFNYA